MITAGDMKPTEGLFHIPTSTAAVRIIISCQDMVPVLVRDYVLLSLQDLLTWC